MTLSRADLIKRGVIRMGGHAGTLSFTSGVSTRAVLSGRIGASDDDSKYVGWNLFMLDAANETDKERAVTSWDADLGVAGWNEKRTDTTSTSETYLLSPDYSLDEYRTALNVALRTTKRAYRYVIPLVPGVNVYSLDRLTWLEGTADVDAVFISLSPGMLHNDDFELWHNGSALAPDGWTLAGSGASVARASTGIRSPYASTVTRASADATLYQDIPLSLVQYLVRSSSAPLPVVSFGAWVTSSTASIARVGVYNGSSTSYSSYYTLSSGVPTFIESSYQSTATNTALRFVCSVDTSAGAASFHQAVMVALDDIPDTLKDFGSKVYREYVPKYILRNTGGIPVVELDGDHGYGQMVIYCRRPFAEMTADTDVVEDQHGDAIVAGMLRYLTDPEKVDEDRSRALRIRSEEASKWTKATDKFVSLPVQPPPNQITIGGA